MGAQRFQEVEFGKTPEAAFAAAVEKARYEYGARGYTGSLAEKTSFRVIDLPGRLDLRKFLGLLGEHDGTEESLKKIPENYRGYVESAFSCYDDKWGNAIAVQVKGQKAKDMRVRLDLGLKRGAFWVFCGWASS